MLRSRRRSTPRREPGRVLDLKICGAVHTVEVDFERELHGRRKVGRDSSLCHPFSFGFISDAEIQSVVVQPTSPISGVESIGYSVFTRRQLCGSVHTLAPSLRMTLERERWSAGIGPWPSTPDTTVAWKEDTERLACFSSASRTIIIIIIGMGSQSQGRQCLSKLDKLRSFLVAPVRLRHRIQLRNWNRSVRLWTQWIRQTNNRHRLSWAIQIVLFSHFRSHTLNS